MVTNEVNAGWNWQLHTSICLIFYLYNDDYYYKGDLIFPPSNQNTSFKAICNPKSLLWA